MFIDDDSYYNTTSQRLLEIEPVADFIAKKIVALRSKMITSTDTDEKLDSLANIVMLQSSLCLLHTAYISENNIHIEQAKNIYRGIDR
jgi:hypothetical protein